MSLLQPFNLLDSIGEKLSDFLEIFAEPVVEVMLFTPIPMHNGELALIRKPTNPPWPSIYDFAFTQMLPAVFTILFLGYLFTYLLRALPGFSFQQQEMQGNIVSAMILTYWAWPFGVGLLAFFNGLSQVIAPPPGDVAGTVAAQLAALGAVTASIPGLNIFSALVAGIDLGAFAGVGVLYAARVMYLMAFMMMIFLLTAFYVAEIPILKTISQVAFVFFVSMSLLPVFVGAGMRIMVIFFSGAVNLQNLGIGNLLSFALSFLLPAMALGFFGGFSIISGIIPFVGQIKGVMGGGGSAVGAGSSGRSLGSVGPTQSDDFDGWVEEKTAKLDEKLPEYGRAADKRLGSPVGRSKQSTKQTAREIASARQKETPTMNSSMSDIARGTTQSIGYNETPDEPLADHEPTPAELMQQQFEDGRPDPGSVDPGAQEPVAVSEETFGELDEETFERAVEGSDMSPSGMQTYLQNLEETHGREAVEDFVSRATMSQAAAESGFRAAKSSPSPAEAAVPDEPADDPVDDGPATDSGVPDLTASADESVEMIETTSKSTSASTNSLITNQDSFAEGSVGEGQWEDTPAVNEQRAAEIADVAAEEWDGEGDPPEEYLRTAARGHVPGVSEDQTKEAQPAEYAVVDQYNKRHDPVEDRRTDTDSFEYVEGDDQSTMEGPEATDTTNRTGSSGGRDPVDILESDD